MEINIRRYCGMRNVERCSAVPVPEYTWVKNTYRQERSMRVHEAEKKRGSSGPVWSLLAGKRRILKRLSFMCC